MKNRLGEYYKGYSPLEAKCQKYNQSIVLRMWVIANIIIIMSN